MGWKILWKPLLVALCVFNLRLLMAMPGVDFDDRGLQVVGAIMVCDDDGFESLIDLEGIGLRAVRSLGVEGSAASELAAEMESVTSELVVNRFQEMCGEATRSWSSRLPFWRTAIFAAFSAALSISI